VEFTFLGKKSQTFERLLVIPFEDGQGKNHLKQVVLLAQTPKNS